MFYRNGLKELEEWSHKEDRKPLILRGARGVGKTSLVNQFSKGYGLYLTLNLERSSDAYLFQRATTLEELISAIYLYNNKAKEEVPTLLFIDEIQNSSKAVEWLRYFNEEAPWLHVIAAASLLESLVDENITSPAGMVEYMAIRPVSFNEFLGALGEDQLKKAHIEGEIPTPLHEKVMSFFNLYTLIGGMPEAVAHYSANRDIVSLKSIYKALLASYIDDIDQYSTSSSAKEVLQHILESGWTYAANRIKFEKFADSPHRSREVGEAFRTLEKAMLLELIYPSTFTSLPLNRELRRSPKLIWVDTGLVNYAGDLHSELFGVEDIKDVWKGAIAEQIIGQELLTLSNRFAYRRHFWIRDSRGSSAELDYLLQFNDKVIPIEVKPGSSSRLRSLHQFMEVAPHDIAVRFWKEPLSIETVETPSNEKFTLYNLPYYYAGLLDKVLTNLISKK